MADRRIIHLDMDAFYASVEVLDNPALRGAPVIVGGPSDRSVVSAASYEARSYGIRSAMPIAMARKLCPHGTFLPVRMQRYREVSAKIHGIFQRFTPLVEPISLDEAFLDVTASARLLGTAEEIARRIKQLVVCETSLTISAGVASSKLVAKIASDLDKPDGLTIVPPGEEQAFLAPLPIERLWGVGKTTRTALALLGVKTIGDISRLPLPVLERKFGKHGMHLHLASLGIDERDVEPERDMKSLGHEETFETDLLNAEQIRQELLALCVKVGQRLRRYDVRGKTVTLKVKYHDFKQVTRSNTRARPTNDTKEIFEQGCRLLEKTEAGRRPVRLLGISLSNFAETGTARQCLLFDEAEKPEKRDQLNKAVDCINTKYGASSVKPGTLIKRSD